MNQPRGKRVRPPHHNIRGEVGARLDLQMHSIQRRRAKRQTRADDSVWNVRLHVVIFRAAEHLCAVRRGRIDAALRQLCRVSGRTDGIRVRHRQRAAAVIDVIRLRTEHRRAGRRSQQSGGKQCRYCLFETRFHSAPRCFVRVVIRKIRHFIIITFCTLCKCFSMAKRPPEVRRAFEAYIKYAGTLLRWKNKSAVTPRP